MTSIPNDLKGERFSYSATVERILVVEDNENVREVVVNFLSGQGYEITEAVDGDGAIKHLTKPPLIDLLFTDIKLPGGISGFKIANQAKQLQPNIKVLLTTAYADSIKEHGKYEDQTAEVILKPYRQAKLLEMIRVLLGRDPD